MGGKYIFTQFQLAEFVVGFFNAHKKCARTNILVPSWNISNFTRNSKKRLKKVTPDEEGARNGKIWSLHETMWEELSCGGPAILCQHHRQHSPDCRQVLARAKVLPHPHRYQFQNTCKTSREQQIAVLGYWAYIIYIYSSFGKTMSLSPGSFPWRPSTLWTLLKFMNLKSNNLQQQVFLS